MNNKIKINRIQQARQARKPQPIQETQLHEAELELDLYINEQTGEILRIELTDTCLDCGESNTELFINANIVNEMISDICETLTGLDGISEIEVVYDEDGLEECIVTRDEPMTGFDCDCCCCCEFCCADSDFELCDDDPECEICDCCLETLR